MKKILRTWVDPDCAAASDVQVIWNKRSGTISVDGIPVREKTALETIPVFLPSSDYQLEFIDANVECEDFSGFIIVQNGGKFAGIINPENKILVRR